MLNKSVLACVTAAGLAVAVARAEEAAPAANAEADYVAKCAMCHGKDGKGESKLGQKVGVKDLTDAQYQASFTDEKAFKDIKEGLKDGEKILMTAFGGKLSDAQIKALVTYVRGFAKQAGK